jgi:hypothetical protein
MREHWQLQAASSAPFQLYAPEANFASDFAADAFTLGSDAGAFAIEVTATEPNASGQRTITIVYHTYINAEFDFEAPGDQDDDNIYEFELRGRYRGTPFITQVRITIRDVLDSIDAGAKVVTGETPEEAFGASIEAVPDITGDGELEFVVGSHSASPTAKGYLITSNFLNAGPGGVVSVSQMGSQGTRFTDSAAALPFENTYLSARTNPSAGVDLLVSDVRTNKLYLFSGLTAASYNALPDQVQLDTAAGVTTYNLPPGQPFAGRLHEGRLIGDLNHDGRNDIFARTFSDNAPQTSEYTADFGIYFGRPAGVNSVAADFDIALSAYFGVTGNDICVGHADAPWPRCVSLFDALLVSDIDGDSSDELAIVSPARHAAWFVYGRSLTAPGTINLDTFAANAGFAHRDTGYNFSSLAQTDDYDSDGAPSVVMTLGEQSDTILLDTKELPSTAFPINDPPGVTVSIANTGGGGAFAISLGDLDGDGLAEVLLTDTVFRAQVMRGSSLRQMSQNTFPTYPPIAIRFADSFFYPDTTAGRPAFLPQGDRIAFPLIHRSPSAGVPSSGRIVFLDIDVIKDALARDAIAIAVSPLP